MRSVRQNLNNVNRNINAFAYFKEQSRRSEFLEGDPSTWIVAVKDNIMVKGMTMECGSRILKGYCPSNHATCIEKLVRHGVSIVGKTNMDEFGMGSLGIHGVGGPVLNPRYTDDHLAGGSSAGSAAAVAAGLCDLAIGSDTGGSVRLPASYCGVYGFKPSYGRISRHGLVSYANSLDVIGLISDKLGLLIRAFDFMKQSQDGDMTAWKRKDVVKNKSKPTIGILSDLVMQSSTEAQSSVQSFVGLYPDLPVKLIQIPSLRKALDAYYILSMVEAASCLERYGNQQFGETPAIIPTSLEFSKRRDLSRLLGFGETVLERITVGAHLSNDAYNYAQEVREEIRNEFAETFKTVDFLVCPTAPSGPQRLPEVISGSDEEWNVDEFTVPANLVGNPAISLPYPIGVQVMAPFGHDEELLHFVR